MKHLLRIPTSDQYAYIEVEIEGTHEEALGHYKEMIGMVKAGEGLEPKEFNAVLDELLSKKSISGDPGVLSQMNIDQAAIIQAIKRSYARLNK